MSPPGTWELAVSDGGDSPALVVPTLSAGPVPLQEATKKAMPTAEKKALSRTGTILNFLIP
ncbi:hypothetical protein GCM10027402_03270 [Arthrobacter monumenti]